MTNKQKWTTGIAATAAALVISVMIGRHGNDVRQSQKVRADIVPDQTIVQALQDAKVPVNDLVVRNVGGITVVRGSGDKAAVQAVLAKLNVARVANMVVGYTGDDDAIRREAERQLVSTRALDGCSLKVSCDRGVIRVTGTVQNDRQIDAAREALRAVAGAQSVKVELAQAIIPAPKS